MTQEKQPLSIQQRKRRNREEIIEDIITIAREMMQQDGAAALSFNAIARRLGIKPPSLYTYFDSKHAIYDEIFRRGWQQFTAQSAALVNREGSLRERLIAFITHYMQFAQENPEVYQIMFQRPVPEFVPSEASLAISFDALDRFTDYLKAILSSEGIDPGIPDAQARDIIIALMHGLTEQHLANNPELPVGEGRYGGLIEPAVDVLLKAWTASPANHK